MDSAAAPVLPIQPHPAPPGSFTLKSRVFPLFYFILFYFILFYSILFYSIYYWGLDPRAVTYIRYCRHSTLHRARPPSALCCAVPCRALCSVVGRPVRLICSPRWRPPVRVWCCTLYGVEYISERAFDTCRVE